MRTMRQFEPAHANLRAVSGGLAFTSSYDAGLVLMFKQAVPPEARKWDAANKRWLIDAQYGHAVARIVEAFLGIKLTVPQVAAVAQVEMRLLEVKYLGACKDRGNNESSAFAHVNGGWNAIFPETVLREWFEAVPQRPDEKPTLYAQLAVKPTATAEEVKSAYRRLARQWHPDVSKEPGSAEVFKTISHAYQVLSNEILRKKYDAGMALEASMKARRKPSLYEMAVSNQLPGSGYGYRAPFRCGYVLAEGKEVLGRFVVSNVLQWEDITDSAGRVLVVSWPAGAETFSEDWR